jgi:hypothetical protein
MSLILMCGLLCFQIFWPVVNPKATPPVPEVPAIVLALFATIRASRMGRPDRSTLRGKLFATGSWLIGASALPSLALALALGFAARGLSADLWVSGCIVAQFTALALMKRGPLTPAGRPGLFKGRVFTTDQPDYGHFAALRSDYWRNTTAEALMIGRMTYGYVFSQKALRDSTAEQLSPRLQPILLWDKDQARNASSSVLALLRTGTLRQALTFVVFRREPGDKRPVDREDIDNYAATYERKELELNPGWPTAADCATSAIDVFVGVYCDEILTIAKHPALLILEAARNKLAVLDVQLPVPPPTTRYSDRRWARVRVALRGAGDIQRLTGFLIDIGDKISGARDAGHVVAVRTAPSAPLRVIVEPETSGSYQGSEAVTDRPVLTTDLDIVNGYTIHDESPAARTWRMLVICGPARSNIEIDILSHLAAVRTRFQLAGLTYALLHGTAVMVLLVHEPRPDQRDVRMERVAEPDQDYATTLERALRQEPGCEKLRVPVCNQLSRDDLEVVADHPFPMLRVRFRCQDRPGAILNVLESIINALGEELPAIQAKGLSISYARVQVLTGQVARGRLTIPLQVPPHQMQDWDTARMGEMAQKIETMAVRNAAEGPVIAIDRIELTGSLPVPASERPTLSPGSQQESQVRPPGVTTRIKAGHPLRRLAICLVLIAAAVVLSVRFIPNARPLTLWEIITFDGISALGTALVGVTGLIQVLALRKSAKEGAGSQERDESHNASSSPSNSRPAKPASVHRAARRTSPVNEMTKIVALFEKGRIDQQEFERLKSWLLSDIDPDSSAGQESGD